ncbi:hypothetical protein ACFFKU_01330 [Kineococcus gynurae]|uniref:Uncharacterized protein n=1 Tax=Kineococcus gynurae TaxID=452979 RepID=A0ABV5LQ23_9ACTN
MTTRLSWRLLRPTGALALALVTVTTLAACGGDEPGEGPTAGASAPSASAPTSSGTQEQPPTSLVDSVVVAPDGSDALNQTLRAAATENRRVQLDVVADFDPSGSELGEGRVVLPTDALVEGVRPLRLTTDEPTAFAVENQAADLLRITGTFTVATADNGYALTALSTESDPALLPAGADDPERCRALQADPAPFYSAARTLGGDPTQRDELREEWGSARGVWWALQEIAPLLVAEEAPEGDALAAVCLF